MVGTRENEREEAIESGMGKELVVMDTPDRSKTQIAASISKFEDSPVFNFLNDLSPIMTAKAVPVTQNMNALSFASMPSVFASPHVSSLKESRFLRRHQVSDSCRLDFSLYSESKTMTDEGITDKVFNGNEQQKIINPENSVDEEVSVERLLECSQPRAELVQNASPVYMVNNSCYSEFTKFDANSKEVVPFAQSVQGNDLYGNEACIAEPSPGNESEGATTGCDWEAILTFDSPMDRDKSKKSFGSATGCYNEINNDLQNVQLLGSVRIREDNEINNPLTQPGGGSYREELAETPDRLADSSLSTNYIDGSLERKMNAEPDSPLYHGVRRRCLVFDMAGTRRKRLGENSSAVSPIFSPSGGDKRADEKHIVSTRTTNNSKCILPGIGLHLNALAANPKEHKCVTQKALASGSVVISPGSTTTSFHSSKPTIEQQNASLAIISTEKHTNPGENEVMLLEDVGHSSVRMENEELNSSSPKKKRRRLENTAEGESACKRCNCKKSKCLKLYCECFAAGLYCVEPCTCLDCFNKPIHEETVLATRKQIESRDPSAFAPKVVWTSDSQVEAGEDSSKTPASARHKRGCNCKKSGCLKKYCECYQGGVGCSINCRCQGCKNAYGRKDGSSFIVPETEPEGDHIDLMEKNFKDMCPQYGAIQTDSQNAESAPYAMPLRFQRPSVEPSFSLNKPPRSLYPSQGSIVRPDFLPPSKLSETISEDEMPEFLRVNGSSLAGFKSTSPNSKRVSPPHRDLATSSPNRRSSRKLILKSIPSFPNLTPNKH